MIGKGRLTQVQIHYKIHSHFVVQIPTIGCLRVKDSCEKKSQLSASFFRDTKINKLKIMLTGGFIRDIKNSHWVVETHRQIWMGVDPAVTPWQNRVSDLQTFPYNTYNI